VLLLGEQRRDGEGTEWAREVGKAQRGMDVGVFEV
jgi:hypothetical protein